MIDEAFTFFPVRFGIICIGIEVEMWLNVSKNYTMRCRRVVGLDEKIFYKKNGSAPYKCTNKTKRLINTLHIAAIKLYDKKNTYFFSLFLVH